MTDAKRPSRRSSRILLEAVSIGFAVLLAFVLEGYREDAREREFAQRAAEAVVAEIESNRAEVAMAIDSLPAAVRLLQSNVRTLTSGGDPSQLDFDMEFSVLNNGAWEAAKVSGATAHFPLSQTIALSSAYRTQEIYEQLQHDALLGIGQIGASVSGDRGVEHLRSLAGLVALLPQLGAGLLRSYDEALAASERPDAR